MENIILETIKRQLPVTGHELSGYEKSVFSKILKCRTEVVPHLYTYCENCKTVHPVYKSCKNRMCPVCNGSQAVGWLAKREAELLPTGYFLLTFTVPSQLRTLFLANKKVCLDMLFTAASKTILAGVRDNDRIFNGNAGFFAVLHTHDQQLNFHPHLHVVVPAGCLNAENTGWNHSHPAFFLPVKRLSRAFKVRLLTSLAKGVSTGSISTPECKDNTIALFSRLRKVPWVVNSQAPKNRKNKPNTIVRYLSRYVNRPPVTNERLSTDEKGNIFIHYTNRKTGTRQKRRVCEESFLKLLALHILPKGFKRTRFYGFMANRCRGTKLALCRMLLGIKLKCQETKTGSVTDKAFLFWKYFQVDILLCGDCKKGHLVFTHHPQGYG